MAAAGWARVREVEFWAALDRWRESRQLLAAAMTAALAPFMPYWLSGFGSREDAPAADPTQIADLATIFDAWAVESQPQWYTEAADPFPAGVADQLATA
jgi:hypothetical protein